MVEHLDMERARREELRWMLLSALYSAQPIGTSEVIIRKAIEPIIPDVTEMEIRRELDYLVLRKFISLEKKQVWLGKINRYGIDFVECTIDAEPGIARPKKW